MSRARGLPFAKFSGAGNDFVVLDARGCRLPARLGSWVRAVCQRRVSVGADGVAVVEGVRRGALRVRFYNPDGRRHDFCGNASRCVARWEAIRRGRNGQVCLSTDAGEVHARVRGAQVDLDLAFAVGRPRERHLQIDKQRLRGFEVLAGVPHFVILRGVPEFQPLPPLAGRLRWHRAFPDGVNVNFVGRPHAGVRPLRTFERGVEAETLACGTGCVAAAAVLAHLNPRLTSPVRFRVRSGARIAIHFRRRDGRLEAVTLSGEARLIYRGELMPEALALSRGGV
ncbi:MAG: diaminopimelate epimerase [Acidobacteriota bacterium]